MLWLADAPKGDVFVALPLDPPNVLLTPMPDEGGALSGCVATLETFSGDPNVVLDASSWPPPKELDSVLAPDIASDSSDEALLIERVAMAGKVVLKKNESIFDHFLQSQSTRSSDKTLVQPCYFVMHYDIQAAVTRGKVSGKGGMTR